MTTAGNPGGSLARAYFAEHGTAADVGGDQPFGLADDALWLVERGFVDVFMVVERADGLAAARRHVTRIDAGGMLAGLDDPRAPGAHLLAVAAADTRLWRLPRVELWKATTAADGADRDGMRRDAIRADVVALADGWAAALLDGVTSEVPPRKCAEIARTGSIELDAGAALRPSVDVAWLRVEGKAHFASRASLPVATDVAYPVSCRLWITAAGACAVHAEDPAALGDALWIGLARLQALVVCAAVENATLSVQADRERQQRQAEESRSTYVGALHNLAGAMRLIATTPHGAQARARRPGPYDDLLRSMGRVADRAGVTITAPTTFTWLGIEEPVDAIARTSRFHTRRVVLGADWWRHDAGPLLGFIEGPTSREAVALLPLPAGGYEMHRPAGARTKVTPAVAALLLPMATAMYRPFPATALTLHEVLRFALRGCWRDLAAVGALGAAGGGLGILIPLATGLLFDTVIPSADRSQLVQLTAILVVVAIASASFELVRTIALLRLEGRVQVNVQAALWDRLLALPISFFRSYAAGDLAVRAMSIDGIRQLLTGTVTTALVGGIFSVFNVVAMFAYSAPLAWRGILLIGALLLVTMLAGVLQLRAQRKVATLRARTSGLVLQLLTSITKLRVAGAEVRAFAIWARQFGEQRRQQFIARFVRNGYATVNAAFPLVASIVIFAAAAAALDASTAAAASGTTPAEPPLRTGEFLAFLAAFSACLAGTLAVGTSLIAALGIVPLYEQARPIFTTSPEVGEERRDPGVLEGDIEAQHLRFRYRPDGPLILADLSFRVRPGESIALVGPSGSGKSTIVRALLGFETLESGAIYLDGHDMSGLDVRSVRRQIGVVLQNSRLSAGDVYSNIVGSSMATEPDAWEAAERAGLADDLREMPMGMNTIVSDGGSTLSGGQRQRLLIARAFVSRPKIVIFDEATSALDNQTQAIVSESLARLHATRIVVAHRLSTVMGADRILVVVGGQIVESGTYGELIQSDGAFAELARRQLA